ncbi:beta-lactamase/transpeptidase-like protein [Neolentinus lepideus HHB14362 ss-1]|uniref:Beta-lactamase/transpeptidase-like protein n=1 Tax=Neolentinus lepideus HHB14362 ss-1 TaxID=1314782 RepID=A0A165VKM3_9AGAM|nr:beta-lactamase/transpeptidase-like protein [Neolentinus lepideus HHB14362 ss-1]
MHADPPLAQLTSKIQAALDEATAKGVATGFQYALFNRDSIIFSGVSGYSTVPTEASPEGVPYCEDDVCQLASCAKLSMSMIVLHILERGLTKQGFTLADLDNPNAVAEVLPEFAMGSGHLVSKVIEGFERDQSGRRVMKLRDPKRRVTLRMLFTHTAGTSYWFTHQLMAESYQGSDGNEPLKGIAGFSGDISDFDVPLVAEPGTAWDYGHGVDWLAQFAVRSTGKNIRALFREIILEPLSLSINEVDIWDGPHITDSIVPMYIRNPSADQRDRRAGFEAIAFPIYSTEGDPPKGKAHYAGASMYASTRSYAKILQAVLRRDERILRASTWDMVYADGVGPLDAPGLWNGMSYKASIPMYSYDVPCFATPATAGSPETSNLLGCALETGLTLSGRPAGSFGWAGIANSYYFIDPVNGIGAMLSTQLMPFFDPEVIEIRDRLEKIIYENLHCLPGYAPIRNIIPTYSPIWRAVCRIFSFLTR